MFCGGRWNRGTGHRETWKRGRTNNVVESYHSALRRMIKVSHQSLYSFLAHLQQLATHQLNDVARLHNGLNIRRPRKKSNMLNDSIIKSCIARFTNGSHSRLQFLRAVSAFCRRAYGHTTAAERQQQQYQGRRRGRGQSGVRVSSDDISSVRISSGASCSSNLRRQLIFLRRFALSMRLKWIDFCNSNI